MRLARFNIQTAAATDKRYFVGMPSPAAAGVIASTIYLFPEGPQDREFAFAALAMVMVPALLMVSTIRFRSVKAIDVGWRRSYFALFLVAVVLALIASHPRLALVTLAYTYTVGCAGDVGCTRASAAGRGTQRQPRGSHQAPPIPRSPRQSMAGPEGPALQRRRPNPAK